MSSVKRRLVMRKEDSGRSSVKRQNSSGERSNVKKLKASDTCQGEKPTTSRVKKVPTDKTAKRLKSGETHAKCVKSPAKKLEKEFECHKNEEATRGGRQKLHNDDDIRCRKPKKTEQSDLVCNWRDENFLAELEGIDVESARNIISLLKEQNTIPFIARYRSHLTNQLKPDKLIKVRESYVYIQEVHERARKLHKKLETAQALTPELLSFIQNARSLEELDFVGSAFKTDSKKTLAQRAKELGLEPAAEAILTGKVTVELETLVKPDVEELKNVKKVQLGIQHIIADIISKTPRVHSYLEKIYSSNQVLLKSEFKKNEEDRATSKYGTYGDFSRPLSAMKAYQTLAIYRGESEDKLRVKIIIPDALWFPLKNFCKTKWSDGVKSLTRTKLLSDSVDDAIKRLLAPLAARRLRARLHAEAESEALSVFGYNLRQLLLTPPCIGHVVMGIDPGFKNGCKMAVVDPMGNVLGYDKFFLNDRVLSKKSLKSLIRKFKCEIIALGNGTACRETETLLSDFISCGAFKPLNVSYTIISEQAASIYSCSSIASEEFPHLDPTIVSASEWSPCMLVVFLARRLQNPLSELVKVEPKHLGVGMYQHDVKENKLVSALDEIVSECVSFVGVDINSASLYLLKRVAGLNASKAQEIIKYRTEVCTFKSREDIKKVKGIKTQTFLQCAGFLRVIPSTARCKHPGCQNDFNPLDQTSIHPESYDVVHKIMDLLNVDVDYLGSEEFVEAIKSFSVMKTKLTSDLNCSDVSLSFIIDTLTKPKDFDLRYLSSGPIFRREVKSLEELSPGQRLEGVVRNVVSFGAFVDVGVGRDGLIHTSNMQGAVLRLNDLVNVQVISVEKASKKIQLKLVNSMER